eukprot:TRINITY_DN1906_c0_g1_i1.p1 TRINITY_DN1906_c0_g1~~TRINITY_DN1906_c0_g1_i1.p1  ORF type:complete len:265 (+),score=56.87 TRINITY_DN1906_c0_g1_i1:46-795(+)
MENVCSLFFCLSTFFFWTYASDEFPFPNLPYDYAALEPIIDETTMRLHHLGHHKDYTTKLNTAFQLLQKAAPEVLPANAYELLLHQKHVISNLMQNYKVERDLIVAMYSSIGGYYNHNFFWEGLTPPSEFRQPEGRLYAAIVEQYISLEAFQAAFSTQAVELVGSGWVFLTAKRSAAAGLDVAAMSGQSTPVMNAEPLLSLDVWEHAYYLKYQHKRKEWVANFWKIVNWPKVEERFSAVLKKYVKPDEL